MKIIINGAAGRMGAEVLRMISNGARGSELAAAVDRVGGDSILPSLDEFTGSADVIIDFSHHSAVTPLLKYAKNIGADYYSKDAKSAVEIAKLNFN